MKNIIKKIIAFTGYTVTKVKAHNPQEEKQITRENFFDLYFSNVDTDNFFFIQVGANDGKTNDPIYPYVIKYKLSGIAVEPQPDVFELLQETYKNNNNVVCMNAAISKITGTKPFYLVKESFKTNENFKRVTGIASFNKKVLRRTLKNKIPKYSNVDDYIQESLLNSFSLDDLIKNHDIKKIDMIQIDCEGYDYEIIKTINFDKFLPSIINFESNYLSDKDRKECEGMLESQGYRWFRYGGDTCAYKI